MFSNNYQITGSQLKKMLILDIISISLIIIPNIAAKGAGKDGIFSILLGTAGAILYSLYLYYLSTKMNGDYLHYSRETVGKFFTSFFCLLYIIKLLFSAIFTISLFSKIVNETLLPNASYRLIPFFLILLALYASSKGLEGRARLSEFLYFIILIPLFLFLLTGLMKITPTNLTPLITTPKNRIIETSYSILLSYSAIEVLLFSTPYISNKNIRKEKLQIIKGILTVGIFNILLFIVVVGLLGINETGRKLWSTVTIMQIIGFPGGFVQRQDSIILTFWLFSIFTILSTYFYYLCKITREVTRVNNKYYYLLPYGIILFFLTGASPNMDSLYRYYAYYIRYIGFPQSLLIPSVIVLIATLNRYFNKQSAFKSKKRRE